MNHEIEREVPADNWRTVVVVAVCVIAAVLIAVVVVGTASIGTLMGLR